MTDTTKEKTAPLGEKDLKALETQLTKKLAKDVSDFVDQWAIENLIEHPRSKELKCATPGILTVGFSMAVGKFAVDISEIAKIPLQQILDTAASGIKVAVKRNAFSHEIESEIESG